MIEKHFKLRIMKKIFFFTLIAFFAWNNSLHAQGKPFTEGNLVLYRLGDGTSTYALDKTNAVPAFLDEYGFDEDGLLDLIQSIALPTEIDANTGNKRCNGVPGTVNMGYINRSADGLYLVAGGFDIELGGGPWGKAATAANRVVAVVDANGNINTTTALTDAFSTKDLRSVISTNGTDIWLAGNNSTTYNDGYVRYTTKGSTTSIKVNGLTARIFGEFKNQLYVSAQERIYTVGSGFPKESADVTDITETPNASLGITATNPNGYDFCFADLDAANPGTKQVLYFTNSNGTLQKYSFVNNVWVFNGDYTGITTPRSLECKVVQDGVELYIVCEASTSALGNGKLYKFKDIAGYNKAFEQDGNPIKLLDWSDNLYKAMRSVAWAPLKTAIPTSVNMPKPNDFSVYTENNNICIESLKETVADVYNLWGVKISTNKVYPGMPTQIAGLQIGQIYFVKVGDKGTKIIL